MTTKIYRASLETRNFLFESFAENQGLARVKLINALARHGKQYNCARNWFDKDLEDIAVREIAVGKSYRDGSEI